MNYKIYAQFPSFDAYMRLVNAACGLVVVVHYVYPMKINKAINKIA